jgi:hypothetical protein
MPKTTDDEIVEKEVKSEIQSSVQSPTNLMVTLQSAINRRLLKPYSKNEPVVYEFTQDRALLHQYFRLRSIMYDKVFKVDGYNWGEDFYDKIGHILIARRGNLCLGGCRLIIREGDEAWPMPMESDELNLRDTFGDLALDKLRHAEISRFAVMDDCGESNIFNELCRIMYDKVTTSDIHYLFVKSPYRMARSWRFIANSFGVKTTRIIDGVHPVDKTLSPDIKWYLIMSDLTAFCRDTLSNEKRVFLRHMSETIN